MTRAARLWCRSARPDVRLGAAEAGPRRADDWNRRERSTLPARHAATAVCRARTGAATHKQLRLADAARLAAAVRAKIRINVNLSASASLTIPLFSPATDIFSTMNLCRANGL